MTKIERFRQTEARETVLSEANSWIGTPFHYEACVKKVGVSCGAFLIACYQAAGIRMPVELPHFPRDWAFHTREERFLDIVETWGQRILFPFPGDTVMFQFGWTYSHAGIVIEWPIVIHAMEHSGVVTVDASLDPMLKRSLKPAIFLSPWN